MSRTMTEAEFYAFATEQETIRTDLIRENNRMLSACVVVIEQMVKDHAPKVKTEAERDNELRDYFAGQSLATMLQGSTLHPVEPDVAAVLAYRYADAMVEARKPAT